MIHHRGHRDTEEYKENSATEFTDMYGSNLSISLSVYIRASRGFLLCLCVSVSSVVD